MFDTLAAACHPSQVNWFHAAINGQVHAFADEVTAQGARLAKFISHVWYQSPDEQDRARQRFDSEGLMALAPLEGQLSDPNMAFYLCGPLGFMQYAARQLTALGIDSTRIHYECFGHIACCKPISWRIIYTKSRS